MESLEEWWKHDHFNVRAFNTLEKLYKQWVPARVRVAHRGHLRHPLPEGRARRPRALRPADARRGLGSDEGPLHVRADGARARRDVREPRPLQRAHERPAQHRHPGRVLRARRRGDEPRERAVQLGERPLARAGARVRHPAVEEPRPALVHRGPQRVRDDDPPPGVAARARPGALLGTEEEPAAERCRHEPRLHPRRGRPRRDRRLLRGQPDDRLHGGAVRLRQDLAGARAVGRGQAHAGRPARGLRRDGAGV